MTIAISNYNSPKGIDGSEVGEMCDGKGGWIGETDCTGQKTGQTGRGMQKQLDRKERRNSITTLSARSRRWIRREGTAKNTSMCGVQSLSTIHS